MSWKERERISHFQQAWGWKRNQPSNREPLFLGFAPRELMKPLPCVRTEHDNAMKGHSCSRGSLSLSSKAGVILSKRTRCTVRNPLNACPQQLDRNRPLRDLYLLCPTEACTHLCPLQKKLKNSRTLTPAFFQCLHFYSRPSPSSVWNITSNALLNRCSPARSWQSILPGKEWRGISRGKGI